MAPSITPEATTRLQSYIDNATTRSSPAIPGAILHIIDARNNAIFSHASRGSIPLSSESLIVIYSCTKIIGAIAFMQLVERNLVYLDDVTIIPKILPELASKKILLGFEEDADGKRTWKFEDRRTYITPRMLMNHTNGTGHNFFNPLLNEYLKDGLDVRNEASDPYRTVLDSPLLWQPGTHTNYGQGFDWLAVLIERLTKQSMAAYLQEHIFWPAGLKRTGYEEQYGGDVTTRAGNEGTFWPRSIKQPDGTFVAMDGAALEKVERETAYPEGKYHTYPLGTGLVSTASELARLLSILLPENNGVDPVTKIRILAPDSVGAITSGQLSAHLNASGSRYVPSAMPSLINPGDLEAEHMDPEGTYGLGCGIQGKDRVLKSGERGRSKGSVYWYGAANTDYWIDREKGTVVVVSGNYFPWNDKDWVEFVAGVEGIVYAGLEA